MKAMRMRISSHNYKSSIAVAVISLEVNIADLIFLITHHTSRFKRTWIQSNINAFICDIVL